MFNKDLEKRVKAMEENLYRIDMNLVDHKKDHPSGHIVRMRGLDWRSSKRYKNEDVIEMILNHLNLEIVETQSIPGSVQLREKPGIVKVKVTSSKRGKK